MDAAEAKSILVDYVVLEVEKSGAEDNVLHVMRQGDPVTLCGNVGKAARGTKYGGREVRQFQNLLPNGARVCGNCQSTVDSDVLDALRIVAGQ